MQMKEQEALAKRWQQASGHVNTLVESIAKDLKNEENRDIPPPDMFKYQIQAMLAQKMPLNDLLAIAAEMAYSLGVLMVGADKIQHPGKLASKLIVPGQ